MSTNAAANPETTADRELVLTRLIDARREKLYRAWTEPALLKQWFAPLPWTTPRAELDVRPGGASLAAREEHEKMGFHVGWGRCTDQLAALVAKI